MSNSSCCSGCGDQNPSEPVSVQEVNRRKFLGLMFGTVIPGAIASAAIGLPAAAFIAAPVFEKAEHRWIDIGAVDQFKLGDTVKIDYEDPSSLPWSGVTAKAAAWVRRSAEAEFIAFEVNCSHLGCPVRWIASAEIFMCPCHGGVYYKDGSVAAGPPPRPLSRYEMQIKDGRVQLQTQAVPLPPA